MARRLSALALVSIVAMSTSGCGGGQRPVSPDEPSRAELRAALTIPPTPATADALDTLASRGQGDVASAWLRLHYLIDLFDDARFRRDDDSLKLLARALGLSPQRGADGTHQVLDALLVETDRILALDRLHPGANDARRLLSADRTPQRTSTFAGYAQMLASIAARSPSLAANAALRQAGRCDRAARDATAVGARQGWRRLEYCLWSLFAEDPADYHGPHGYPTPPWSLLEQELLKRYGAVAQRGPRLAPAARARRASIASWLETNRSQLPRLPDLTSVAKVARAPLYAWTPRLGPPNTPKALGPLVAGDGRATAAWVAPRSATAEDLLAAAWLAGSAGAARLELVVAIPMTADSKRSRLWQQHVAQVPAQRAGVLPLSLGLLGPPPTSSPSASLPRGQRFDTEEHKLGLAIEVSNTAWRLVGHAGEIAKLSVGSRDGLGNEIDRILSAFPDLRAVAIIAENGATVGDIADIASLALFRKDGSRRVHQLALARSIDVREQGLRRRVERRAAATVAVNPATLEARAPVIRRCFQDLLDSNPRARTTSFEIERDGTAVRVTRGPKRGPAWACVVPAVSEFMVEKHIDAATVVLSPTAAVGSP